MTLLTKATAAMFVLDGMRPAPAEAEAASRLFPDNVHWTVLSSIRAHPAHTSGATGFASDVLSPEEMETRSRADRVEADGAVAATARGLGNRPVRQLAERGDAVATVIDLMADQHFDVVVAASSDTGEHLVEGGVPRVLVVPQSRIDSTGPVLIAVDDSPTDESLMAAVAGLLGSDAECIAVHIADVPPTASAFGAAGADAAIALQPELRETAEQTAEHASEELRDVTPAGGVGRPVGGILDAAQEHDAALIVLGSKDRGWLSRLLRPSISDAVLHRAQRPVLVISDPDGMESRGPS